MAVGVEERELDAVAVREEEAAAEREVLRLGHLLEAHLAHLDMQDMRRQQVRPHKVVLHGADRFGCQCG